MFLVLIILRGGGCIDLMRSIAPPCRIWTCASLFLAARVLSASEAFTFPVRGPDYVVERVCELPQLTIRAITQTQDGYLWIRTYNGLIRFDGVRSIKYDLAHTPRLSSDGVYCLYEDRLGDLWIGTDDGGVIRYREGEFQAFGAAQ